MTPVRPVRLRAAVATVTAMVLALAAFGAALAESKPRRSMTPSTLSFDVPALRSRVELSHPAWLAATVEETPYQLLRICTVEGACHTMADLRGLGGMSVLTDETQTFSPDRLYMVVLAFTGINRAERSVRSHVYTFYGLREATQVRFRTAEGKDADSASDWAPDQPHARLVTVAKRRKALAFPVSSLEVPAQQASAPR